ncbi:MAG: 30S ribosomal protein S3 [Oscillospiraceae bacterium]|jgi:ribosomal protein S3|nr:MAG: 30S ribosomal protein S3 [Oscillospiraceae bacterium]
MGQKVNPHGLRVGVIKDWDSRWFTKDEEFGDTLVSDYKVREYLKKTLFLAGVPKIEIERDNLRIRVFIHCAKPGMVIGRGGSEIDKLRVAIEKIVNKPVVINVVEIRQPDLNAQLVAESIASQLERRISFRRAMKSAIGRTMKLGAKGIKVSVGGRLGGAEIARTEHYHEGTIPLQTIRADIDYGFWEANTTYGKIGVKVWIYNGEVLMDSKNKAKRAFPDSKPADQRDGRSGGRRNNGGRNGGRGNFAGRGGAGGRGNFAGRGGAGGGRGNFAGKGGAGGRSNKEGGAN